MGRSLATSLALRFPQMGQGCHGPFLSLPVMSPGFPYPRHELSPATNTLLLPPFPLGLHFQISGGMWPGAGWGGGGTFLVLGSACSRSW